MEKCAILVSSCDKYHDAWVPFFTLLKKYWNPPYPVYLNTESENVTNIAGISITSIPCPYKNCIWSKRLIHALKQIDSEYIIFMLEDFFIMRSVDQKEIAHCISLMDKNKNTANINFGYGKNIESTNYIDENYAKRSKETSYYLNAQAAVWRRKILIKLLSPYENAWQFELYGSNRAKLYPYDFIIKKDNVLIIEYHAQAEYNVGINKGMWMPGNVEFFEKEGIPPVNFDNLGFYSPEKVDKTHGEPPKRTFKEKWMRFLYASEDMPYWKLSDQFKLFFSHPVLYAKKKVHALRK